MSEAIVIDGDLLQFDVQFGHRKVTVPVPGKMSGTGHAQVNGKKVCILGDEKRVLVSATYTTDTHSILGDGKITISALDSSQQAFQCTSGSALIIQGKKFIAMFKPGTVATALGNPPPPPDASTPSDGEGRFIPQQSFATVN
ncbi:hypothetical protein [Yersinia ruckeri]|uniref:hypothetical protein n=1 Tax=Yersinia ruckeri TaxID=29486 RepID=UPI0005EA852F|nr:hypothetical protein [Yersinia ruckeri]AKA38449.1 hypothetical protein UGYR_08570 [Yersinia ruckeri]MCW6651298.1 hypothetical protein [Yersinia ruckeri]